jgi:pimeloyl-ACP methyl ester carboxylesterase
MFDLLREPLSYWPILVWDYLTAGTFRTLRTLAYAVADPLVAKLPHVPVPTLVVRGERDPIAPRGWVEEMVHRLPHGQLAVIPGAAHVANYSAPAELARLVRGFLAEPAAPDVSEPPRRAREANASLR